MSTIPSDVLIASLCNDIYSPTALVGPWDHIDAGMDDGVFWALRKLDGFDIVVFRGSITPQDWLRDFIALAMPTRIGHVHTGFFLGMEKMWGELRPMLSQPVIVSGHSLGAGRAAALCGLMIADGAAPVSRVVFGEPKPGLVDLAKYIAAIPARSYRNGDATHHDPVTDVPFSLPPLEYVHPTPIVPVCAEPTDGLFGQLGIFAWHHVGLYLDAVTTACGINGTLSPNQAAAS